MNNDSTGKNINYETIHVECHSGYKANERPTAFTYQGRRQEISEILDRWYEGSVKPDDSVINYFKIKTNDGSIFIIRYVASSDKWSIHIAR